MISHKPIIFVYLFLLLFVSACKNEVSFDEELEKHLRSYSSYLTSDIQFPTNPYDSAGILHNLFLAKYLAQQTNSIPPEQIFYERYTSICRVYKLPSSYKSSKELAEGYWNFTKKALTNQEIKPSYLLSMNPYDRVVHQQLIDSMSKHDYTLEQKTILIKKAEIFVINSPKIPQNTKSRLLGGLSVWRHSLHYWQNDNYYIGGPLASLIDDLQYLDSFAANSGDLHDQVSEFAANEAAFMSGFYAVLGR